MSYYEQLREVSQLPYTADLDADSTRKAKERLEACRITAAAFLREVGLSGATARAIRSWLSEYETKLDRQAMRITHEAAVHERARDHMRDARDKFHSLSSTAVSEMERQYFSAQETVTVDGVEMTGEAYLVALAAQKEQERDQEARAILKQMDADVIERADELGRWKPVDDVVKTPGEAGRAGTAGSQVAAAPSGSSVSAGSLPGVGGAAIAGAGAGSAGAGDAAGAGARVPGVEPLPDGAGGAGSAGSGAGAGAGGRIPGVAPLPGEPGSPGNPITDPADLADMPLTTRPVFSDGMDHGYVPAPVNNINDPRWTSSGPGVAVQSGLAVGGGLLASRGGGAGTWSATSGASAGGSGYGTVPAGGVIGRPGTGMPGVIAPGAAGGTGAGAGGPMVAGGVGGAGAPGGPDAAGGRAVRSSSLKSSLAEARAAVDRAAGTKPAASRSVIRPSDGNVSMMGGGQGGRGRDEEERRRRQRYSVPKLERPDDHQHDAGHWAFGAGSADTLPPVPRTRDDDQW